MRVLQMKVFTKQDLLALARGAPLTRARPKQSARVSGVKLWDSSAPMVGFFMVDP